MKDWFKARNVWGAAIATLTDEEAGRLMKAIWAYTMNGEQVELTGAERGIFALILLQLSQDDERESDISAKRAMAGSKGGKQTQTNQANATFATEEEANQANATNKNKSKNKNKNKEQDIEEEEMFTKFWNCYPRHEAKQNALKAFQKIHPNADLLNLICAAIEKWKKTDQWTHDGGQYIPHPATWLNQRRWEDNIPSPAPQGQVKRVQEQAYEQRQNNENQMSDTPEWFREYQQQLTAGE